jgi:hypothetical protein
MISLQFNETMAGSYHLASAPSEERPMSFTVRARSLGGLRGLLRGPEAEIEGEIDAEGLADHRYLRGRLDLALLRDGTLGYAFQFTANDGRRCAFEAKKKVRAGDVLESMTVLPGRLLAEGGEEIGAALLRFDLRSDLLRFLRSFRLVR